MYIYTYIYIYARKLTVSQNGKPCGFKAVSLLRCQLSPACSRAIAPCHNNKQISLGVSAGHAGQFRITCDTKYFTIVLNVPFASVANNHFHRQKVTE